MLKYFFKDNLYNLKDLVYKMSFAVIKRFYKGYYKWLISGLYLLFAKGTVIIRRGRYGYSGIAVLQEAKDWLDKLIGSWWKKGRL
ncbi:unnamed protein product [Fusarium fujikuroi]|uniref:Uncharacterized protein n=1 Tax=Fusarium fujikuroi TaxID=5127 RepID=A0A9Q9RE97_FUSFU|nr:unnamed protein product [Fusarium fujikuroi]